MSKDDIAKYLRDYAIMSELIRTYPNMKIGTIYKNYMTNNGRSEEINDNSFIKMIRVYDFITELRIFSFIEDISIDYLNEDDLDFDEIATQIFVNPVDSKKFHKKEIVRYIRNAFNHNDDDNHSKYNISVNGRYLEIDLLDARKEKEKINNPNNKKPFHIKIDGKQLYRIKEEALNKMRNLMAGGINYDNFDFSRPFDESNIDNLEFVRFYFNKKIDLSIIKKIWESNISRLDSFKSKMDLLASILNSNKYTNFNVAKYPLNDAQKEKLKLHLKGLESLKIVNENNPALKHAIHHLFNDAIPLGMFHIDQLYYEQRYAAWMMDPNLSYNEVQQIIKEGLAGKNIFCNESASDEYKKFHNERFEMLSNFGNTQLIEEILMTRDYNSRIQYPIVLYLGYISDSLLAVTEIEIAGKKYDADHIRNAFVHGRWFLKSNDMIELYDCPNGNNSDYSFDWNDAINLHQLLNSIDNLYTQKKERDKSL